MKKAASFLLTLLALASGTSAIAREDSWPIEHSTTHVQCPWRLEGPTARVFTNPSHWLEIMNMPEDKAAGHAVDWHYDDIIVFGIDTQRNLGTRLKVDPPVLQLSGREARLQVDVNRPRPGQMTASAIARPCVVAVVRKRSWRTLEVRETDSGMVLWRGRIHSRH